MRQKKAGTWELIVELGRDPLTNRRKQRSKTFHGPKREAERQLRALIADVETGRLTDSSTTVNDIVQKCIDLIAARRAPSTMREYRRILRERTTPAIGEILEQRPPTSIDPLIESYRAGLGVGAREPTPDCGRRKKARRSMTSTPAP